MQTLRQDAGQQEVGHANVTAGRRVLSLPSIVTTRHSFAFLCVVAVLVCLPIPHLQFLVSFEFPKWGLTAGFTATNRFVFLWRSYMNRETKQRILQFGIILVCAVFLRVTLALIAPFELQQYFSFGVLLAAIVSFFTWDFLRGKKKDK